MLNLSNVVFRIKMKLGIANMALPFDNINDLIVKIIQEITIPTFSIYSPDRRLGTVNVNKDFIKVQQKASFTDYLLPDWKNDKLLYINDVYYNEDTLTNLGYYAGSIPTGLSESAFVGNMMLNNINAMTMNYCVPKMTFKFSAPRNLRLYNAYWSAVMTFDWSFEHSKSLNTIPDASLTPFIDLAILDVKDNLYPTVAQYVEQTTQYGNIRLAIDDWQNAASDRKDLLEKWEDTYHLDGIPFWYG